MGSNRSAQTKQLITNATSWVDLVNALNRLGTDGEANNLKGAVFEELTRLYLITEPTYKTKLRTVWHHSTIPQNVLDELKLPRPEIGVDLVALARDGTYWAIQCKFHQDPSRNVTYDELSTFFSITERKNTYEKLSYRLICSSTTEISNKVHIAHPHKVGCITEEYFARLNEEHFDQYRKVLAGETPKNKPLRPRQHQLKAIEKIERFFSIDQNTRGKLIHPCGSGKSLTAYWAAEALKSKNILIAVPSIALVGQTLRVWTKEAVSNDIDIDWIAVCSDEDVSSSDDPSMNMTDLGIEVTTSRNGIIDFLRKNTGGIKVVVTTYHSSDVVISAAEEWNNNFDLGIFDEAHKTVGQKDKAFARLLNDDNIKIDKRIFMTATERIFKSDSDEVVSMDRLDVYGQVIDEFSFKAAIEEHPPILSDYKIVTITIQRNEIERFVNDNNYVKENGSDWDLEADASTLASVIALRKVVKERKIKHVVSFHSSIKRAKEFRSLNLQINNSADSLGVINSFHVSGKDSSGVRAAELGRFISTSPSLITNARCLIEGVDIPAIDAVLFADPKQSKVDIVQAAGRALRTFGGKQFGYIIVPIVVDGDQASYLNQAFQQIINVISAMGMADERIIDEFQNVAKASHTGSRHFEIQYTQQFTVIKFQDFIDQIDVSVWDRLSFAKTVDAESKFTRWLKETSALSPKSCKNYIQATRKILNDLIKEKIQYNSIEDLLSSENLHKLQVDYFSNPKNSELDKRGKNMYSAGFKQFIQFYQSTQ